MNIHFTRTTIVSVVCLVGLAAICQTKIIVLPAANPTLQKIIEVREMRDSNDRRADSLIVRLNKAIAIKGRHDIVKKNR